MTHTYTNQSGATLFELIIAVFITLVVAVATLSIVGSSFSLTSTTYELTDAQENLRIAHEFLSRDLVNTGDGLTGLSSIQLPTAFVTKYLTKNPLTETSDPTTAKLGIITSDDNVAADTLVEGISPLVSVRSYPERTDRVTFLTVDQSFTPVSLPPNAITPSGSNVSVSAADIDEFNEGEIYFITSSVGGTFGYITNKSEHPRNLIFADNDPYGLNHPGNGGPINRVSGKGTLPTLIRRMQIVHYFIDSRGLLIRRCFGVKGRAFNDSVIAEHVVNMQFRYLLDKEDSSGRVVQPVTHLATSDHQLQVRNVDITITVETVHGVIRGMRPQLSMNTSWSVRNMQFRQAQQPTSAH
jgi:hypothetical protein